MASSESLSDVKSLVRSRHGAIFLQTADDRQCEALLRHLADHLQLPYFRWSLTKGLRRDGQKDPVWNTTKPGQALQHIEQSRYPGVYHLQGMGDFLEDKIIAQRMKDAAAVYSDVNGAVFVTGDDTDIPHVLRSYSASYKLPLPSTFEFKQLLLRIGRDLSKRIRLKIDLKPSEMTRLLNNLRGLTLMEAEKILTCVLVEDRKLGSNAIQAVMKAKKNIVEKEGLLEYYPAESSLSDIADLKGLKSWLVKRREIIMNPRRAKEFGLTFPRGILLLGVQGCGKSLCAKAVAKEWNLPLLKFDPSNLYNKYIGESEKNFKRAIKTAEQMAPVVLWIDEIEKAFSGAGGDQDGGTTTRIFGTFLGWLQERRGDVFVIATANDIKKLPPEFLRKGRFDEIFFVDLPSPEARWAVFEIHLRKRNRDPRRFDLSRLVRETGGFSGAEIEQIIVAGLYSAFSTNGQLSTERLLQEIHRTKPLSVTLAEPVAALRRWATTRTVLAN